MHDHYGKYTIFGIEFRAIPVVSRKPLQSAIYEIAFFDAHMDQTLQSQRYFSAHLSYYRGESDCNRCNDGHASFKRA